MLRVTRKSFMKLLSQLILISVIKLFIMSERSHFLLIFISYDNCSLLSLYFSESNISGAMSFSLTNAISGWMIIKEFSMLVISRMRSIMKTVFISASQRRISLWFEKKFMAWLKRNCWWYERRITEISLQLRLIWIMFLNLWFILFFNNFSELISSL